MTVCQNVLSWLLTNTPPRCSEHREAMPNLLTKGTAMVTLTHLERAAKHTCEHCGKRLERKRQTSGKLEQWTAFFRRRFCGFECFGLFIRKDMTGQRFGKWEVLRFSHMTRESSWWVCRCDCGTERPVSRSVLMEGSWHCGCEYHGMCGTPTYGSWESMIQHCYNPNASYYKDYGGRGIKVCDRWRYSFRNFYDDMKDRPDNCTLSRKDNDGDYTPENCEWATIDVQNRNKRTTRFLTIDGVEKAAITWAEDVGMNPVTLYGRLARWKDARRAVFTPVVSPKRKK